MATLPNPEELWTVREYLRTSWSPDREFVDGRIEERNLGEKDHSIRHHLLHVFPLFGDPYCMSSSGKPAPLCRAEGVSGTPKSVDVAVIATVGNYLLCRLDNLF